jgi:serine protease Do
VFGQALSGTRVKLWVWTGGLVALLVAGFLTVSGPSAAPARAPEATLSSDSFTSVAAVISPAVVHIRTAQDPGIRPDGHRPGDDLGDMREFFERFFGGVPREEDHPGEGFRRRGTGSGFIVAPEGYVVTNHHVILDADQIEVVLKDGRTYPATVIGQDAYTDLALLKIDADADLPALPMGDSDSLAVGQWVVAIGSPYGLSQSVTIGIVSAKGRVIGSGPYDDFIQTDAAINPGNSGGPLVDLQGTLVGINTAIVASGHGIGFAIPVNLAQPVLTQLRAHGQVTRGWFGVAIQELTPELMDYYAAPGEGGVLVTEVFAGQPAHKAGMRPQDVILAVAGQPMSSVRDLTYAVAGLEVDQNVDVKIWREGAQLTLSLRVSRRVAEASLPDPTPPNPPANDSLGLQIADVGAAVVKRFQLEDTAGVVVTRVESGSRAQRAGVLIGDVIREINHQPVVDAKAYRRLLSKLVKDAPIDLLIKRPRAGILVIRIRS